MRLSFVHSGDFAFSSHEPYGTLADAGKKQLEHTLLEVEPVGSDATGTHNVQVF